jgi:hypothetical protein
MVKWTKLPITMGRPYMPPSVAPFAIQFSSVEPQYDAPIDQEVHRLSYQRASAGINASRPFSSLSVKVSCSLLS